MSPSTPTQVQQEQLSKLKQLGLRSAVPILQTKHLWDVWASKLFQGAFLGFAGRTSKRQALLFHPPSADGLCHYPYGPSLSPFPQQHRSVPGMPYCCLTHLPIPSCSNIQQQYFWGESRCPAPLTVAGRTSQEPLELVFFVFFWVPKLYGCCWWEQCSYPMLEQGWL